MRHGGITGFEVKIGRDGGIYEPGTGPSYMHLTKDMEHVNLCGILWYIHA